MYPHLVCCLACAETFNQLRINPIILKQVFIDDNAILSLICTKLTHPEYYIVSANVVNQPMISWLHLNLGAVLPYLPDMKNPYPKLKPGEHVDWRASKLPTWKGSLKDVNILEWNSPEEKKHRWLPIRGRKDHVLDDTPIVNTEYEAFGKGLQHWQIAAQQHYSFFENLENNELHKYMYNTWDFGLKRVGIQFMAIMGSDINRAKPIAGDDEQHFSVTMPEKFGRAAVAMVEPLSHITASARSRPRCRRRMSLNDIDHMPEK